MASVNSRATSRPAGEMLVPPATSLASEYGCDELNSVKPSWCFAVITAYRMPAACASSAHLSAKPASGANLGFICRAYSAHGTAAQCWIHSA